MDIDRTAFRWENTGMTPTTLDANDLAPTPQSLADEDAVMAAFVNGTPVDPEVGRRVHERAMKIRDEIRRRYGVVDFGVPAIRELRGELPDA
jgi:hypothetical protein